MNESFRGKALSLLNLHLAGVLLLLALNVFLAVRLFVAWRSAGADREDQIAQAQVTYEQLQSQTRRLRGLSGKVDQARTGSASFYAERMPASYSAYLGRLGELSRQSGARLTGASYTQSPAIVDLAEIRIDAHMNGNYSSIVRFINAVERDRTFFVINGLTLTGQQGGLVNLRLRMTTYLHGIDANTVPASVEDSTRPVVEAVH